MRSSRCAHVLRLLGQPSPRLDPQLFDMGALDTRVARSLVALRLRTAAGNNDCESTRPLPAAAPAPAPAPATPRCSPFATPGITREHYAQRRADFLATLPQRSLVVVIGSDELQQSHDILHPYCPNRSLYLLCGCREPGAVLVLSRGDGVCVSDECLLFCQTASPKAVMWHGARCGPAAMRELLGIPCADATPRNIVAYLRRRVEQLTAAADERSEAPMNPSPLPGPCAAGRQQRARSSLPRVYLDAPSSVRYTGGVECPVTGATFPHLAPLIAHALCTLFGRASRCDDGDMRPRYGLPMARAVQFAGVDGVPAAARDAAEEAVVGSPKAVASSPPVSMIKSAQPLLLRGRLRKSPCEVRMFIRSADITAIGFAEAMRLTAGATQQCAAVSEADVAATMEHAFRRCGALLRGHAYIPVVAGGSRALTLHYTQNDAPLCRGDLLMVDAGAQLDVAFPTDCTRAWPVDGTFTAAQAALYDAVLRAQRCVLMQCRPGASTGALHNLARRLLWEQLVALRICAPAGSGLPNSDPRLIDLFFPHHFGHFCGFDIHEDPPGAAAATLTAGCMHTVEPGLYIPELPETAEEWAELEGRTGEFRDGSGRPLLDPAAIPAPFRGLGLRLEDQLVVLPAATEDRDAFLREVFECPHDPLAPHRRAADYVAGGALVTTAVLPKDRARIAAMCAPDYD